MALIFVVCWQEAEEGGVAIAEVQGDHSGQPGPPGSGGGPCVEAGSLRGRWLMALTCFPAHASMRIKCNPTSFNDIPVLLCL